MSFIIHGFALALACLAVVANASKVETSTTQTNFNNHRSQLKPLAMLLFGSDPAAAFNPSGPKAAFSAGIPVVSTSHRALIGRQHQFGHRAHFISMSDDSAADFSDESASYGIEPDVVDAEVFEVPSTSESGDGLDTTVWARKRDLLAMGASTARGEAASPEEKSSAETAIEFLELNRPATEISDACLGTWELILSNTQPFRSSPFFMAGRATCKDGEEAARYNWFCDMHRAALAISTIQRVRQVVSPFKIVSEFEVMAGAVPFVGEYFNIKYSGGLPFAITGSIVSTADIVSTEGNAWRMLMDTVEIKGSNIPALRQVLDSGVKLETRALGDLLEQAVDGYTNPNPEFRVTYVDDDLRISRDQDDNWFVYVRTSDSQLPKDYSEEPADLGVGKLLDGLQRAFLPS